jgi:hypothetical protein
VPWEPERGDLRRAYVAALGRHLAIKRELVPLIVAWRASGIETLLFKGFFLSEFVYPVPGARFHGDVDLLVLPEHGRAALQIAEERGWRQEWIPRRFWDADAALLYYLRRPGGAALLDVHRLLPPAWRQWTRRQREITEAVWANSELREWEGTAVRLPSAVDAIVVNLAVERATQDNARGLKAYDAVDLFHLTAQGTAGLEELRSRAREIGCRQTLESFLRLCRPSPEPVAAGPLRAAARTRWKVAGHWEAGFVHVPWVLLPALRAPGLVGPMARAVRLLARVRRTLRNHQDVREVLARLTPTTLPAARSNAVTRWRTVRSIYWMTQILPCGSAGGRCLQQALAVYTALRRQGWDVTFVCGVRRDATGLVGHAWVEEHGQGLAELAGRERVWEYVANFRYPPAA